jgi:hypothetical protein
MKELKRLIFLILTGSCLFYSCSGNSIASVSNDNGASSPGNSPAKSTGDASFSCKIDGKNFSGKGNDSYSNVAIVTSPGLINFVLVSYGEATRSATAIQLFCDRSWHHNYSCQTMVTTLLNIARVE